MITLWIILRVILKSVNSHWHPLMFYHSTYCPSYQDDEWPSRCRELKLVWLPSGQRGRRCFLRLSKSPHPCLIFEYSSICPTLSNLYALHAFLFLHMHRHTYIHPHNFCFLFLLFLRLYHNCIILSFPFFPQNSPVNSSLLSFKSMPLFC